MALSDALVQRLKVALANAGISAELVDAIENPTFGEDITFSTGVDAAFGTGQLVLMRWSAADVSNPSMVIALDDTNQGLHITDKGAVATDWNIAATTHPNVYIHSNTTPATDYLRLGGHDGTTADIDVVGGTTLRLMAAGTAMTTITATAVTLADAQNIVVNETTGTKIGTATGQKIGFFNATPVVQQSALTAQLTTLTHTAPSSQDFALQNLVQNTGFGFVTADEGNTTLQVIVNLQARMAQIETALENLGLIAAN